MELGKRASQQQEAMIREVLTAFSADLRSTLAEKSVNTSPDLLKVAEEVVASQSSPFQAKKVGLSLSQARGTRDNFRVNGEETRLRRVLSNLLENALRYSPAEGNVIIKLIRRGWFSEGFDWG
jgi:signal transduction histidine kinase